MKNAAITFYQFKFEAQNSFNKKCKLNKKQDLNLLTLSLLTDTKMI